jgi:hypothetical protein
MPDLPPIFNNKTCFHGSALKNPAIKVKDKILGCL